MAATAPVFAAPPATKAANGFIIVAVLWILAALATVAGIYAFYVRETAAAFGGHVDRLHAQTLAHAAVELAAYRMLAATDRALARGGFSFRAANAQISIDIQPESGRIDLNAAPKEVLAGLFSSLGARPDAAEDYALRIVAWRSPVAAGGGDDEASLYRVAGKSYGPRRAPFQHTDELTLVLGMPPGLAERALPYLTVYSGRAEIDGLSAPPQVLAALPGMNAEMLHAVLADRQKAPQRIVETPASYFGPASRYVSLDFGVTARIAIRIELDGRRRMRSEAVIVLLPGDTEPYRVLSWFDDVDEPSSAPMQKRG